MAGERELMFLGRMGGATGLPRSRLAIAIVVLALTIGSAGGQTTTTTTTTRTTTTTTTVTSSTTSSRSTSTTSTSSTMQVTSTTTTSTSSSSLSTTTTTTSTTTTTTATSTRSTTTTTSSSSTRTTSTTSTAGGSTTTSSTSTRTTSTTSTTTAAPTTITTAAAGGTSSVTSTTTATSSSTTTSTSSRTTSTTSTTTAIASTSTTSTSTLTTSTSTATAAASTTTSSTTRTTSTTSTTTATSSTSTGTSTTSTTTAAGTSSSATSSTVSSSTSSATGTGTSTSTSGTSTTVTNTTGGCPPGTAWSSDAAGCVPCPTGYTSDATTQGCLPLLATVLRTLKDPALSASSDNVGMTTWSVAADKLPALVYPSTVLEYAADVAMTSAALVQNSACSVRWQPMASGGLQLVEPYNGTCASKLNTTTSTSNVERRGFVGVFLLVSSPDLGSRQRVGSWVIPITLRLPRASAATFDSIAVWSSLALPAQTFAMTSLSSSLEIYNSSLFANQVLTPFYKDGDTVFAEHDLDADGAALNLTVVQLWLSNFSDGRDVAVNLTSSLTKLAAPYGAARIRFVAKACRYCFLQSLAQVSAPNGRRLADARFSYANLALDIGGSQDSTGVHVVETSNNRQGEAVAGETTTAAPGTAVSARAGIVATSRAWKATTAGGALLAFLSAYLAASA